MWGILICTFVASYLVAALFALAKDWNAGKRGLRRISARDTVLAVALALVWPPEESWLRLRQYFSAQWVAAEPRWQGVES